MKKYPVQVGEIEFLYSVIKTNDKPTMIAETDQLKAALFAAEVFGYYYLQLQSSDTDIYLVNPEQDQELTEPEKEVKTDISASE